MNSIFWDSQILFWIGDTEISNRISLFFVSVQWSCPSLIGSTSYAQIIFLAGFACKGIWIRMLVLLEGARTMPKYLIICIWWTQTLTICVLTIINTTAKESYWRGGLITADLLVLTSLDQLLFILKPYFSFLQKKPSYWGGQLYSLVRNSCRILIS